MGIQRNPRDQNCDPEDFQDDEDQEQWRQTLIYIGGALNNKFKILSKGSFNFGRKFAF